MGLFYSVMSYFKSFYPAQTLQLSEVKIATSAKKLTHTLRHKQSQMQKETRNLEANLIVAINQPKNTRSIAGEQ